MNHQDAKNAKIRTEPDPRVDDFLSQGNRPASGSPDKLQRSGSEERHKASNPFMSDTVNRQDAKDAKTSKTLAILASWRLIFFIVSGASASNQ
jgi:hypothetical protein